MVEPTQLNENTRDASSSSSSPSDGGAVTASCLIHFVVGIESSKYIGNGGLITGQKVLVAREVLKDYEVMTEDKNLYGYAPKGVPNKNIFKVTAIYISDQRKISIAQVSTLFGKTVLRSSAMEIA